MKNIERTLNFSKEKPFRKALENASFKGRVVSIKGFEGTLSFEAFFQHYFKLLRSCPPPDFVKWNAIVLEKISLVNKSENLKYLIKCWSQGFSKKNPSCPYSPFYTPYYLNELQKISNLEFKAQLSFALVETNPAGYLPYFPHLKDIFALHKDQANTIPRLRASCYLDQDSEKLIKDHLRWLGLSISDFSFFSWLLLELDKNAFYFSAKDFISLFPWKTNFEAISEENKIKVLGLCTRLLKKNRKVNWISKTFFPFSLWIKYEKYNISPKELLHLVTKNQLDVTGFWDFLLFEQKLILIPFFKEFTTSDFDTYIARITEMGDKDKRHCITLLFKGFCKNKRPPKILEGLSFRWLINQFFNQFPSEMYLKIETWQISDFFGELYPLYVKKWFEEGWLSTNCNQTTSADKISKKMLFLLKKAFNQQLFPEEKLWLEPFKDKKLLFNKLIRVNNIRGFFQCCKSASSLGKALFQEWITQLFKKKIIKPREVVGLPFFLEQDQLYLFPKKVDKKNQNIVFDLIRNLAPHSNFFYSNCFFKWVGTLEKEFFCSILEELIRHVENKHKIATAFIKKKLQHPDFSFKKDETPQIKQWILEAIQNESSLGVTFIKNFPQPDTKEAHAYLKKILENILYEDMVKNFGNWKVMAPSFKHLSIVFEFEIELFKQRKQISLSYFKSSERLKAYLKHAPFQSRISSLINGQGFFFAEKKAWIENAIQLSQGRYFLSGLPGFYDLEADEQNKLIGAFFNDFSRGYFENPLNNLPFDFYPSYPPLLKPTKNMNFKKMYREISHENLKTLSKKPFKSPKLSQDEKEIIFHLLHEKNKNLKPHWILKHSSLPTEIKFLNPLSWLDLEKFVTTYLKLPSFHWFKKSYMDEDVHFLLGNHFKKHYQDDLFGYEYNLLTETSKNFLYPIAYRVFPKIYLGSLFPLNKSHEKREYIELFLKNYDLSHPLSKLPIIELLDLDPNYPTSLDLPEIFFRKALTEKKSLNKLFKSLLPTIRTELVGACFNSPDEIKKRCVEIVYLLIKSPFLIRKDKINATLKTWLKWGSSEKSNLDCLKILLALEFPVSRFPTKRNDLAKYTASALEFYFLKKIDPLDLNLDTISADNLKAWLCHTIGLPSSYPG